jgi:RNA polymerase sigma-70 factor, ECF subfamily
MQNQSVSDEHMAAVERQFLSHHSALRAFVLSLLPDFAAAEDVVQETFLVVKKKAGEFHQGSNFFAWVCAIARVQVLRVRREQGRPTFSLDVIETLTRSVPDEAFDVRQLEALSHCLDRLPGHMRKLMKLRYLGGHGPNEIARLVSQTLNSVNVTLSKARAALRICVDRELRREDLA